MKHYYRMEVNLFFVAILGLIYNISFAKEITSNDLQMVNRLKYYEFDSHNNFQEELYKTSDEFIKAQSEKFVDEETGFFNLWAEVIHYFDSDVKKNAKWKSRVDKYFRSTEYSLHIKEKQFEYSNTINTQREELLGKIHVDVNSLNIITPNISTINSSDEVITTVVKKVNKLVLTEVIPEVIESIVLPLIWWFIGILLSHIFLISINGLWLKRILFVLLIGI